MTTTKITNEAPMKEGEAMVKFGRKLTEIERRQRREMRALGRRHGGEVGRLEIQHQAELDELEERHRQELEEPGADPADGPEEQGGSDVS